MRCRIGCSLLCGIVAGILIDYIQLFAYYLVFPNIQGETKFLVGLVIGSGTLVAVEALCLKNKSFGISLLCWVLSVLSFVFSLIINGYVGAINFLLEITNTTINAATENVIGMLTLLSSIFIFGITFIIIIIRSLVFRVRSK